MGREGATVNKPLRSPFRNLAHAWGEGGSWNLSAGMLRILGFKAYSRVLTLRAVG